MTFESPSERWRKPWAPPTRWRTLRWRLTVWYAGVFGLSLALVAVGSLLTLANVLEQRSDRYLRAAWRAFATELLVEAREIPSADSAIAMTQREVHFEDTRFLVTTASDHPTSGIGANDAVIDDPGEAAQVRLTLSTRAGPSGGSRIASGTVAFHRRAWIVLADHPRAALRETVAAVALAYALALPVVLGLALVGGYVMARRALAPVSAMGRRTRAIEASTLHDRLPVDDPHDELGELAGVINALLARLEIAFAQQRQLIADASHELRTPVAVLLAEADVLLARHGRPEAEYRERVGVLREAAARLARLVDDLFLLTRADSGQLSPRIEPLYLDELVSDAVRAMQSIAAQRGVHISFQAPAIEIGASSEDTIGAPMDGDPALLDRLLLNLLDNAIKYSPDDATIVVTLDRVETRNAGLQYVLRVADEGPGISVEDQPLVFDRFFRADQARSRPDPAPCAWSRGEHQSDDRRARDGGRTAVGGAGLGLPIARWVAEVHGGSLAIERSTADGTTMRVDLPAERMSRDSHTGDASGS